jgi:6-phosphogluconolactonase
VRIHVAMSYTQPLARRFLALMNEPGPKSVALSGGRTPRDFFLLLATDLLDRVPWERLTLFQVDERCVAPDHAESNWRQIKETLLDAVPGARAHPMRAETPDADAGYERLLRTMLPLNSDGMPIFDLVLLGLGTDGHTASLFPGTAALNETRRAVVRNAVPQLNAERVTLTYPVINSARHRWFLLRGADRREVFREVLSGQHPAGRIRDPEWFVEPETLAAQHE